MVKKETALEVNWWLNLGLSRCGLEQWAGPEQAEGMVIPGPVLFWVKRDEPRGPLVLSNWIHICPQFPHWCLVACPAHTEWW